MTRNHGDVVLEDKQPSEIQLENEETSAVTDEDIFFAKERYNLHQSSPEEGVNIDILKKYFTKKYGF